MTIFSLCNPCAGAVTKWRKSQTSTARGYQKSPNSISNLIICQRNVFGCDGASKGCQGGRNLLLQSENRGQFFSNWNHYVRFLGDRPDYLSLLSKLCVVRSSDGEFCGILAKTGPFRVASVFRGGWWRELKCGQRSQFVAPGRRWASYSHCMESGSNDSSRHTRPISMSMNGPLCWHGKL